MISLSVENLTKKFNQKVILEDLNFRHSEGILGISGANGSGKSTLMKCLAYLLRPTAGSIKWMSENEVIAQKEVKKNIGFAAPYISLYTELTVAENLIFLMEVSGNSVQKETIDELLVHVQMRDFAHQLYGSLSTGQQQRVKLASALLRNPKILFLDEPGSNLDAKGHSLVREIIQQTSSNGNLVIIASNDQNEIDLCDQVVQLTGNSEQ